MSGSLAPEGGEHLNGGHHGTPAIRIGVSVVALVAVAVLAVFSSDGGPGPVPVCNGEQATHVLVAQTETVQSSEIAEAVAPYQEWADQGVVVVANQDAALRGTPGHDVLVALVSTNSGGFFGLIGAPSKNSSPTAGDFMCSGVPGADDIYYGTRGFGDVILDTGGGSDDIYLGGGDGDLVRAGAGIDFIWGFKVLAGHTQRIFGGPDLDHNYVGAGRGSVIVDGEDGGDPSQAGGGDHIHPCKNLQGITAIDIEYIGTEVGLGKPPNEAADPCAYQFRNFTA